MNDNLVRPPIDVGMVPTKLFKNRLRARRLVRLLIVAGIVPIRLLPFK